jgi:hypothetical protein
MKRLAEAGPRAVAFNVVFTRPAPAHDEYFIAGVEALAAKRIGVVTSLATYTAKTPEWYRESSPIMSHPNVHAAEMFIESFQAPSSHQSLPSFVTAMRRGDSETLISLPIYAWAMARRPGSGLRAELSYDEDFFEVKWFDRDSQGRILEQVQMRERIPTSYIVPVKIIQGTSSTGQVLGDVNAYRTLEVPKLAQMQPAVITYQDAMSMDAATLESKLSGRIVVIGNDTILPNGNPATPLVFTRQGELVPGSRTAAAAIEGLCRGTYINFIGAYPAMLLTLACGVAGALIAAKTARWKNSGVLAAFASLVVIGMLVTAYAMIICHFRGVIINPVVPTLSGLLGGVVVLPMVLHPRNRQRVVAESERGRFT